MADSETVVAEVPQLAGNPPTTETTAEPAVDELTQLRAERDRLVADYAKLQGDHAKLELDHKSTRGLLKSGLNERARVDLLEQRLTDLDDGITALVSELSADPEAPQKVAAIKARQKTRQDQVRTTLEGQLQGQLHLIGQQVGIAHGFNFRREPQKVQELMETAPEWAEVRELVTDAWEGRSIAGLNAALEKAEEIRQAMQERKLTAAVEKARTEALAAGRKETLKETGALSMPGGAAVGAGGGTHDSYVQRLKEGKPLPSSEEIDRIVAARMKRQ